MYAIYFRCANVASCHTIGRGYVTFLRLKSILVRTSRLCNGCGGRKLFPSGAIPWFLLPCIRLRRLYNCNVQTYMAILLYQIKVRFAINKFAIGFRSALPRAYIWQCVCVCTCVCINVCNNRRRPETSESNQTCRCAKYFIRWRIRK